MKNEKYKIICAIDLIDNKCVRLKRGDFSCCTEYSRDPLKMALDFQASGFTGLHLVNLRGALEGKNSALDVLRLISKNTDFVIDYAGGIRNKDDFEFALNAGADKVNLGTLAVNDFNAVKQVSEKFGPQRIIISLDTWAMGNVCTDGWSETSALKPEEIIEMYRDIGIKNFMLTDISRDGMLSGPDINLYKKLINIYDDIELIAGGGISSPEHVRALFETGIRKCVVGKALYENPSEIRSFINIEREFNAL